ncbi:glucose-methanol-choline oxidoreductase [Hypoxylon rubiginosum]|uniref:Glucose-methanol-choline oxidoreductase n=1 Tax=Hypoxylon rubiginosum TaxID=110542 RepID=A0ACB9Z6H8_9PEZI|nr:glucose-methanol-choline oxidoreductase [Hypoxylon rubiginosum]
MRHSVQAVCVSAVLAAVAHGTPIGRLLGSSFGVPGNNANYDYVVVGGGNAGLTLASRLVEQKAGSVAVIEAGTFYEISNGNTSQIPGTAATYVGKDQNDWQPMVDWGYITVPQAGAFDGELHYPRGKTLGGCSARNYMIYQRGTIGSYEMWADAVNDTSYTFDSFLPYFEKSMNFTPPNMAFRLSNATVEYDLSTLGDNSGPVSVTFPNWVYPYSTWAEKGLAEIGMNIREDNFQNGGLLGQAYAMFTINADTMLRESSETAFLQKSLDDPNYYLYPATLAKKIIFDDSKTATGVLVSTDGKEYTISARKEVILSGGVIGSPQLLQASGVGPAELLTSLNIPVVSDLPGVGQNFQDHIVFGISHRINSMTASSYNNPTVLAEQIELFNEQAAGMFTSPATDILAWEKIPNNTRSSFADETLEVLSQEYPADWPEVEYIALSSYLGNGFTPTTADPNDGSNYATLTVVLSTPRSRGSVNITSSDTSVSPAIDPAFLTNQADVDVSVGGFKRAREYWATEALKGTADPVEAFPGDAVATDEDIANAIRGNFQTIFHGACTCSMGSSDNPLAVVDSQTRVYGVQNLRVVDASAFPLLPPGHPMSTVYALAEKIACDISGNC